MGEYPRLASFSVDTSSFCARILKMNPNPLENKMSHPDPLYDIDNSYDEDAYYDEDCYVEDDYYDDSMDGDFDSAMRDAGFGTDEDYGYYGEDY
jgi:hypothetical protein